MHLRFQIQHHIHPSVRHAFKFQSWSILCRIQLHVEKIIFAVLLFYSSSDMDVFPVSASKSFTKS